MLHALAPGLHPRDVHREGKSAAEHGAQHGEVVPEEDAVVPAGQLRVPSSSNLSQGFISQLWGDSLVDGGLAGLYALRD